MGARFIVSLVISIVVFALLLQRFPGATDFLSSLGGVDINKITIGNIDLSRLGAGLASTMVDASIDTFSPREFVWNVDANTIGMEEASAAKVVIDDKDFAIVPGLAARITMEGFTGRFYFNAANRTAVFDGTVKKFTSDVVSFTGVSRIKSGFVVRDVRLGAAAIDRVEFSNVTGLVTYKKTNVVSLLNEPLKITNFFGDAEVKSGVTLVGLAGSLELPKNKVG